MEDIIKLRQEAKILEPLVRIGKNGLTEGMISEIKRILMKKRIVKIKMLRQFFEGKDKKDLASDIAEKTNSILVESIGNTLVLCRK